MEHGEALGGDEVSNEERRRRIIAAIGEYQRNHGGMVPVWYATGRAVVEIPADPEPPESVRPGGAGEPRRNARGAGLQ